MADYECITYEKLDNVARISHNRPEASNAESQLLLDEMDAAFTRAEADDDIRVIIIAGKGKHFSAGHDLKEAQAKRANFTVEERWAYESLRYFDYCIRIWDSPKPTIAQVQGACVAGGFMMANMCDLVIASDDAFFADPVCHTLATASIEVLIHPWVMGLRQAKHLLFTGGRLKAEDALRIGMVNSVVPRDDLDAAALAEAAKIAAAPPFALRLLKRSLNRTFDVQGMRSALEAHFELHQLSHETEEFAAIRAKGLSKAIRSDRK
ncbi:enoyl-CoA hydratase [Oricola indica]|uniref:enoyl-CoA hydratase n=1 Tax=Oricola indica TaxID=2872591 RepID=UPI003CCB7603